MGFYNPKDNKDPESGYDKNMLFYAGLLLIFGWLNIMSVVFTVSCFCGRF